MSGGGCRISVSAGWRRAGAWRGLPKPVQGPVRGEAPDDREHEQERARPSTRPQTPGSGPHRVEFPHVTEIAERRQAYAGLLATCRMACGSNGADAMTYGPSSTASQTSAPPATASDDDTHISARQGTSAAIHASRCGNAEPIVSAPTTMPSAVPRRSRNQPAAILRPGGKELADGNEEEHPRGHLHVYHGRNSR